MTRRIHFVPKVNFTALQAETWLHPHGIAGLLLAEYAWRCQLRTSSSDLQAAIISDPHGDDSGSQPGGAVKFTFGTK